MSSSIVVRRIPVESAQDVVDFVNSDFARTEPLCDYLGGLVSKWNDLVVLRSVEMGMCVEAIDTSEGDKRVGVFIIAPWKKGVVTRLDEELSQMQIDETMGKIDKLMSVVKESIADHLSDEYMDGFILSVLTGYAGRGIARLLIEAAENLTWESGIKLFYIGCTSTFSAKVVQRCGFQEIYSLPYDSYLINGERVFNPLPPHDSFRAFIKLFPN